MFRFEDGEDVNHLSEQVLKFTSLSWSSTLPLSTRRLRSYPSLRAKQMSEPSMCCTLSATELEERRSFLRETLMPRIVGVTTAPGSVNFVFPNEPGLEKSLRTLIQLERECCSFLTFSLVRDRRGLTLTIEGPPQAHDILQMFVEAACPMNRFPGAER